MHNQTNIGAAPAQTGESHEQTTAIAAERDYWEGLIDEGVAAQFLDHSTRTLQGWRSRGGGPKYIRVSGRSVKYRRCDCKEWFEALLRTSTSDSGDQAP